MDLAMWRALLALSEAVFMEQISLGWGVSGRWEVMVVIVDKIFRNCKYLFCPRRWTRPSHLMLQTALPSPTQSPYPAPPIFPMVAFIPFKNITCLYPSLTYDLWWVYLSPVRPKRSRRQRPLSAVFTDTSQAPRTKGRHPMGVQKYWLNEWRGEGWWLRGMLGQRRGLFFKAGSNLFMFMA